jgi:ATP-dependent metalloprotease
LSPFLSTIARRTFLSGIALDKKRTAATSNPTDNAAQLELFKDLKARSTTDVTKAVELVDRYEELTGLFRDGAQQPINKDLLKVDEAFYLYLEGLTTVARATANAKSAEARVKVSEAATKRAAAVGLLAPVSAEAVTPIVTSATPSLSPTTLITALFSGSTGRGKGGEARVVSAAPAAALGGSTGSAAGGSTAATAEPIRVIVEEVKSPMWQRAVRFLFVTLLYSFLLFVALLLPYSPGH